MQHGNCPQRRGAIAVVCRIAGWILRAVVGTGLIAGGISAICEVIWHPQELAGPFRAHPWLLLAIGSTAIFSGVIAFLTPVHILVAGYVLFWPWPQQGLRNRRNKHHNG
jgi:hypothetical protein